MAELRSIRARREPTPTGAGASDTKSFLPEELLSEQVQRLALFCLIAAALWSAGFVMDLLVLPYATGHAPELALADARVHERAGRGRRRLLRRHVGRQQPAQGRHRHRR